MMVALMNERTRQPVATTVEIAATRTTRRRGLLGRDHLDQASAMLLAPCTAVHTAGMRFPIDVVFVDRQGYAVKVVRNLRPWRMALAARGRAVIEMAAGSLSREQVVPGDRLYLVPASDHPQHPEHPANVQSVSAISAPSAVPSSALRRLCDTGGTSIVEAAVITPLLLLLTFSIVDFGALFYVYLALENGVSQATRFGVTGNLMADPANPAVFLSRDASIKLAMRQSTPTLTIPDAAFTFSHMAVGGASWTGGSGGANELAKVSVAYTWRFFNPMMWAFFPGGQLTLTVDSAMKNEVAPPS